MTIAMYMIVVWSFSNPRWLGKLHANVIWLERIFGIVLIAVA